MTADSTSWVAESASSTTDPDARAGLASDGERGAGFHSDVTIDEDAVDGLLTAKECGAQFEENRDDGELYAQYRRPAVAGNAPTKSLTLAGGSKNDMP